MFSDRNLKSLIIPLFLEQLLVTLVGLADTLVVGFVSEAAMSGVSLVNSFNTIFIYLLLLRSPTVQQSLSLGRFFILGELRLCCLPSLAVKN